MPWFQAVGRLLLRQQTRVARRGPVPLPGCRCSPGEAGSLPVLHADAASAPTRYCYLLFSPLTSPFLSCVQSFFNGLRSERR